MEGSSLGIDGELQLLTPLMQAGEMSHRTYAALMFIEVLAGSFGLLLGLEAPVVTPNGVDFSFLLSTCWRASSSSSCSYC